MLMATLSCPEHPKWDMKGAPRRKDCSCMLLWKMKRLYEDDKLHSEVWFDGNKVHVSIGEAEIASRN